MHKTRLFAALPATLAMFMSFTEVDYRNGVQSPLIVDMEGVSVRPVGPEEARTYPGAKSLLMRPAKGVHYVTTPFDELRARLLPAEPDVGPAAKAR